MRGTAVQQSLAVSAVDWECSLVEPDYRPALLPSIVSTLSTIRPVALDFLRHFGLFNQLAIDLYFILVIVSGALVLQIWNALPRSRQ